LLRQFPPPLMKELGKRKGKKDLLLKLAWALLEPCVYHPPLSPLTPRALSVLIMYHGSAHERECTCESARTQ